jgi:hypothetical protein
MATGGVLGNGTKVGISSSGTSPITYTKVGQLMDIPTWLQLIAADVDTTVHGTSNIKTSMPGMIDPPDFGMMLLSDHDPSTSPTHETLRKAQQGSGDVTAGNDIYFRVEIPVNRQQTLFRAWNFAAYVKEYTPSAPIDDKQTTQVTVRYSGSYSVDSGAGASLIA